MKIIITDVGTLRILLTDGFNDSQRNLEIHFFESLGLKQDGDSIRLIRRNAPDTISLAYLETEER